MRINKPILVLQYPDSRQGRTVAIAATKNIKALRNFKEVVLEEARLAVMDWTADEVLNIQERAELDRLQSLFEVLIPDVEEEA